jgi:hypothetical protein
MNRMEIEGIYLKSLRNEEHYKPNIDFSVFVADQNTRVGNYNNLLAQRHGHNAKQKGNDADNTENK